MIFIFNGGILPKNGEIHYHKATVYTIGNRKKRALEGFDFGFVYFLFQQIPHELVICLPNGNTDCLEISESTYLS